MAIGIIEGPVALPWIDFSENKLEDTEGSTQRSTVAQPRQRGARLCSVNSRSHFFCINAGKCSPVQLHNHQLISYFSSIAILRPLSNSTQVTRNILSFNQSFHSS